jgi:hypothetical protein
MARQEAMCWRCGAVWLSKDGPRAALRLIPGGVLAQRQDPRRLNISTAVAFNVTVPTPAQLDADGWTGEGGGFDAEATAPSPTAAANGASRREAHCCTGEPTKMSERTYHAGLWRPVLGAQDAAQGTGQLAQAVDPAAGLPSTAWDVGPQSCSRPVGPW